MDMGIDKVGPVVIPNRSPYYDSPIISTQKCERCGKWTRDDELEDMGYDHGMVCEQCKKEIDDGTIQD